MAPLGKEVLTVIKCFILFPGSRIKLPIEAMAPLGKEVLTVIKCFVLFPGSLIKLPIGAMAEAVCT